MRDTGKLKNDCDELCVFMNTQNLGVGWEKEQRQDAYPIPSDKLIS